MDTTTSALDVDTAVDDTDVQAGFQALAGTKFFLTRNIALFGEYKFVQTAEFSFELQASGTVLGIPATETATFEADLTEHMLYAGVAYHF